MLQVNELDGFGVSGAEGLKLTYLGTTVGGSGAPNNHAFSNVDCGSKPGLLLLGFSAYVSNTSSAVASATLNGAALELENAILSTSLKMALFKAEIPSTGLSTVAVALNSSSGTVVSSVLHAWLLEGYQSKDRVGLVTGTSTSVSGTLDAAAVVGLAAGGNSTGFDWTALIERYEAASGTGSRMHSAADGVGISGTVGAASSNTSRLVQIAGYN